MRIKKIILFLIFCLPILSGSAQELKPNPKLTEVIVVFKTHFDIGYTDYAESVVRRYGSSMIEGALKNLDASLELPQEERFVWTLPGWPMKQILERSYPDTRKRVETALKDGNFAIHALPFTFETEAGDLENLARSFEYSSEISKTYGLELPRDAKMTDVPSHSWFLPTLLKNAGIDFLHLGCNPASQSPEVPLLFWWEGPDGSRLMTMYYPKYYGTELISPEGWPFKSWLALIPTNDNQGAPPAEEVKNTLEKIRELAPNAKIRIGRISDFYDLLIKENPDLPVVKGDMPDTWIHGYMSMPKEVKVSRQIRRDMFSLETLNAQLNLWTGISEDINEIISKSAESSLLFDEHTFGMAMSHGHSGHWAYGNDFRKLKTEGVFDPIELSWAEKGNRIYAAQRRIVPNYKDELERLALNIDTEESHITVYNPLPWKRSGVVEILRPLSTGAATALKDASTGEVIALTVENNVIGFIARDVPAMGYKTYYLDKSNPIKSQSMYLDRQNNILENNWFKIEIDAEKGGIKSLFDKRQKREVVNTSQDYGFGNYLYERFSKVQTEAYANRYIKAGWNWALDELGRPGLSDEPYRRISEWKGRVSYEQNELKISAILHFDRNESNPHDYSLVISLYKDQPSVEIIWGILSKEAEPWPEAGWIGFPINIENPTFKAGRLGGVVDPTHDFVKNSNFDYFFLSTGIAILDKTGNGYGISSPDVPGISLDRPGLWTFTGNFIPKQANVFFNLYNNQWSTNFTEWIEGSWNARFYLWSIEDYENEKDLYTPSEELRIPLQGVFASGGTGELPLFEAGVSLSLKGVALTAFRNNPEDEGILLRIWEQSGNSGECIIQLPNALEATMAQPVNLRGTPTGAPLSIRNGKFSIDITPSKPYSFILK